MSIQIGAWAAEHIGVNTAQPTTTPEGPSMTSRTTGSSGSETTAPDLREPADLLSALEFVDAQVAVLRAAVSAPDRHVRAALLDVQEASHSTWLALIAGTADHATEASRRLADLYACCGRVAGSLQREDTIPLTGLPGDPACRAFRERLDTELRDRVAAVRRAMALAGATPANGTQPTSGS